MASLVDTIPVYVACLRVMYLCSFHSAYSSLGYLQHNFAMTESVNAVLYHRKTNKINTSRFLLISSLGIAHIKTAWRIPA